MMSTSLGSAIDRQLRSRFRSPSFWIGASLPVVLISGLLLQTARATNSPAAVMFLAILSALWVGGSSCIREIVDERRLVQRDPHLSLFAYGVAKIVHATLLALGQSLVLALFLRLSDVVRLPLLPLWTLLMLTTVSGSMLSMLLSAVCEESASALAWFPLLLVPQVVFGGFLFPYGPTRPFHLDLAGHAITEMPSPLVRSAVNDPVLRIAGAICVSRWALEGYAAQVMEQNLEDPKRLQEAVAVGMFLPVTLAKTPIASRLVDYARARAGGVMAPAPVLSARGGLYVAVLSAFAAGQAALLLIVLPLRDPRRSVR